MITQGRVGNYELINLQAITPDQMATLKAWLMHLPKQSPAWSHYMLGVIHLRPIEGGRPVNKHAPDVEHEIIMCALDPESKPDANNVNTLVPLHPINYSIQFAGLSDEKAIETAQLLVTGFAEGGFLAEPDGFVVGYVRAREHFYRKVERYIQDYVSGARAYWRR